MVVVLLTYVAYEIPVWFGMLDHLDPKDKAPAIFQWFLGLITLGVIFLLVLASIKIGDAIGDCFGF